MKRAVFFIFLMQCFTLGFTQNVPGITGSGVSVKDAGDALDFHNKARKEVQVPPLEWSVELAKYAQGWADFLAKNNNCQIAHRRNLGKETLKAGENIFWGFGKESNAMYASKAWYSEIKYYNHSLSPNSAFSKAGHYTQMVWRKSKKVGMGMAKCKNGATIIVSNYSPPGNFLGEKPY